MAIQRWFKEYKIRRKLENQLARTAHCDVGEITGPRVSVAVQGRAHPIRLVHSPISGREVLAYRVRIKATLSGGTEQGLNDEVVDINGIGELMLQDDTGAVVVGSSDGPVFVLVDSHPVSSEALAVALTGEGFSNQLMLNTT